MQAPRVTLTSRPWQYLVIPPSFVAATLAAVLLVFWPLDESALLVLGLAGLAAGVVSGAACAYGWRRDRREAVVASETGLVISSRHGDQRLAWKDLSDLGWVVPTQYTKGGLAGRLATSGRRDLHEPARWLCSPAGVIRPEEVQALRSLASSSGVRWHDYARTEVGSSPSRRAIGRPRPSSRQT